MTLTKCPHCGHTVLSVASQCPACSGMLGQTFLGLEHQGELAECRSCGHPVRSRTAVCPHCGMERPAGRHPHRAALPVLAAVVLGALAVGLRQQVFHQAPPATAQMTGAAPLTQPAVARPIQAAPPPLPDSAPAEAAIADSAVGATDSAAVADADSAAPTSLPARWVADWANMRMAPANDAPVVRVLAPGTMVRGTPGKWGWWAIQYKGDTVGYIAGALLRSSRPAR